MHVYFLIAIASFF